MAGQAKTRWNERVHRFVDGRPEKKQVFYQADETFLDSKAYLRKGTDEDVADGNWAEEHIRNYARWRFCASDCEFKNREV